MCDKKAEVSGGWDAKINARPAAKDAAGKARGYEDAEAQMREDQLADKKSRTPSGHRKE